MPAQKIVDKHSLKILNMEAPSIPPNNSHQQLMTEADDSDSGLESSTAPSLASLTGRRMSSRECGGVTVSQWVTVIILCFINLINYMDRYTIAGVLTKIQKDFHIENDNDKAGLLQTAFVVSYMLFAPFFGYMGDRYNRKIIMGAGVVLWSLTTLAGSYMNTYYSFLAFRALVGIGEASYSTIAPTIISDMFVKEKRSRMLALFYFAIPVGSGLGYIVGAEMERQFGHWKWALRLTPGLGIAFVIIMMMFMREPMRGECEGAHCNASHNSWSEDLRLLIRNKSFMLSTLGFTCVAFVAGALAFFGPKFLEKGFSLANKGNSDESVVTYKFGVVSMFSGLVGVPLGPLIAQLLRPCYPRVDALVCAFGLLLSAPIFFFGLLSVTYSETLTYVLIFFGSLSINLNWSIVADILLQVVPPTRRSTAEAFQILISHALGDASSPYLIGVVSDVFRRVLTPSQEYHGSTPGEIQAMETADIDFYSMQYALFITCFVEILGGCFFLLTAIYVQRDKDEAEQETANDMGPQPEQLIEDEPKER